MKSEERQVRFKSLEAAAAHHAQQFAECSQRGEHEGAKAALREILKLFPPGGPARENFELQQGVPVRVSGAYIGHLFREPGCCIQLSDVFTNPAFRAVSGDQFDRVYLRTVSGNLYRIARAAGEVGYYLADGKAHRKFPFSHSFPTRYAVTVGAPFSGDVIKSGGPMLRRTSAVTEIVLVSTFRTYELATLLELASEESNVIDEYENLSGSRALTVSVEPLGTVAIAGSTHVGFSIRRAVLGELFAPTPGNDALGPSTHVFLRTSSNNIYRIERDVPEPGCITVTDMRVSRQSGVVAERTYALSEITEVVVELGAPLQLGNAVTSDLKEIVAFNTQSSFTPNELTDKDGASSSLVEEFDREMSLVNHAA